MEEIHIAGTGIWYPDEIITNDEIVSLSITPGQTLNQVKAFISD